MTLRSADFLVISSAAVGTVAAVSSVSSVGSVSHNVVVFIRLEDRGQSGVRPPSLCCYSGDEGHLVRIKLGGVVSSEVLASWWTSVLSDLEVSVISERISLAVFSWSTEAEVDGVAGGQPGGVEGDGGGGGGDGALAGALLFTGPGAEEREKDREEDEAVQSPQEDHQEDHLEEGDEEIAGSEGEADNTEDGADGSLDDWQAESKETGGYFLLWLSVLHGHVVVADVSRIVHAEADAHDQVDQSHAVKVDSPPRHVAEDARHDAHDGEGHPERAEGVGDHDETDDHHEASSDED